MDNNRIPTAIRDEVNARRLTGLLTASVKLEQEKLTLEAMRAAVRKQEAVVEACRNEEYKYRLLK